MPRWEKLNNNPKVSTSIPIKGTLVALPDIVDAFLWFIFRFIGYGINLTQL
jgi:hypothetical protein